MSFLFTLDEKRLAEQLPAIFESYEQHIRDAEPLFNLKGQLLETIARTVPRHQVFYSQRSAEMKQVTKWLENYRAKLEAGFTKNYAQGPRALATREAVIFINGEGAIVELNQLIIEATLLYHQLDAVTDGFKTMNFMVTNITKLRVAELEEAIL